MRSPHLFNYKGYDCGDADASSGGLLLHQMMKMIEDRNIGSMGFQSAAAVQLMTEVERRAYADRAEYMGDADLIRCRSRCSPGMLYLKQRMSNYHPRPRNTQY